MQRRKTGKISIFNSLDVIFDFLTSQIENSNLISTWNQYQIESECWNRVFESSQKIDIEYSSWVRRLISKLNLTISLFLPDQKNELFESIVINDEDEWEIDDILNFRRYRRRLQYRVKWNDYDNDLNWYNADDDEFINTQKIVDDFHIQYLNKSR